MKAKVKRMARFGFLKSGSQAVRPPAKAGAADWRCRTVAANKAVQAAAAAANSTMAEWKPRVEAKTGETKSDRAIPTKMPTVHRPVARASSERSNQSVTRLAMQVTM